MTSILTNEGALAALQTLRSISSTLGKTQQAVSTGLRVATAADNAAYWSIATTMRSDRQAVSAVSDALGLGAAKVDTAYAGMTSVLDVLGTFKEKLVASKEESVDKTKIQTELDQLKQQVQSIAGSSSFSGQNWLNTHIADIRDAEANKASVVSSFERDSSGVSVKTTDVHLSGISLFNSTGGGLLQPDDRTVGTIGGIRRFTTYPPGGVDATVYDTDTESGWMYPRQDFGSAASFTLDDFPVGSPLDFNVPGAQISFDLLLDKEDSNPHGYTGAAADLEELPGPYYAGYPTSVTITKADVDAFDSSLGGVISTNTQFAGVLNSVLNAQGAQVYASYGMYDPPGSNHIVHDPKTMTIQTRQMHGDGSYVEISNLNSVGVGTGGLKESSAYGYRGSGLALAFDPFVVDTDGNNKDGVQVTFDFSVNGAPAKSYSFDRTYVDTVLGKDTGTVETSGEMATLLHSLLDVDWPGLVIDPSAADTVIIKSDPAVDRKVGTGTNIRFDKVRVSIEPLATLSFMNIDVVQHPDMIDRYLQYMELISQKVTAAAATLGSLSSRIDLQSQFSEKLIQSIDKGVGRLVDADMEEMSSRLSAVQTQQQIALRSLSIANASPNNMLALFR